MLAWHVSALDAELFCSCLLGVGGKCRVVRVDLLGLGRPSSTCQINWGGAGNCFPVQKEIESKTLMFQERQKRGQSCGPFFVEIV